ncbi:hypothetical protein PCO86_19655 [Pectobacteriaceae bacterium CE70]|nr:hypothetical protein PCO87_20415 [Pectobacteriaceae bacterium C52]WJV66446.1 hypothetical protein PCO86_19655 [Pectobacteriaceae bacterium CE70]WJY10452.1 hypothetical protein PCO80_19620 [Pectobacteriaceae bacterium C80]
MSRILLLGATGLVGGELLRLLMMDPRVEVIYAPTRHPLSPAVKVVNPYAVNLPMALSQLTEPVDIAFCCLGTTRKQAGSRQAFRAVDYSLVVECAGVARRLGASHLLAVSAMSADLSSPFFYSRVKGETEQALMQQDWPRLTLARPSMLLGLRPQRRWLESLSAPLFKYLPASWRAIEGKTVAQALLNRAFSPPESENVSVLTSQQLQRLAQP